MRTRHVAGACHSSALPSDFHPNLINPRRCRITCKLQIDQIQSQSHSCVLILVLRYTRDANNTQQYSSSEQQSGQSSYVEVSIAMGIDQVKRLYTLELGSYEVKVLLKVLQLQATGTMWLGQSPADKA